MLMTEVKCLLIKDPINMKAIPNYFEHILQLCFREGRAIPKGLPVIKTKENEPHETFFSFILIVI